jgi:hypothetical protein
MGGSDLFVSITGVDIDANDTVTFITTSEYIRLWAIDSDGTLHFLSVGADIPNQGVTFNKSLRTPNGDIVAVGKASQNYDVSSACFFRFTATGDTLATAFWPVDQGSQYLEAEAYDLALMDNGNILVTCSLNSTLRTIMEIDQDGSVVSRFSIPGQNQINTVSICREANTQSYLIAYRMGLYPSYVIYIDRFENGVFETLFTISDSYLSDVNSMILGPEVIYVCGLSGINGSLLSLNYNGALNWSRNQQGSNTCEYMVFGSFSTALLGLDSLGCVYWVWGNSGQQVIIKLLPNGQVPVQDYVQTSPVNLLTTYPNPMTNHLTIKATNDDPSLYNASIDIFNIKGQLVRSLKLVNNETNWDGKDKQGRICPNGIYLLRSSNRNTHTTKICKTR